MKQIIVDKLPPALQSVTKINRHLQMAYGPESIKRMVQTDMSRHLSEFMLKERMESLDDTALMSEQGNHDETLYALRLHILTPAELEVALQMAYDAGIQVASLDSSGYSTSAIIPTETL
jgi:hypothetical protein